MNIYVIIRKRKLSFTLPEVIISMCLMSIICIFSYLSYQYFTEYFLEMKNKYTKNCEIYSLDLLLNIDLFCAKHVIALSPESILILRNSGDSSKYFFTNSLIVRYFKASYDTIYRYPYTVNFRQWNRLKSSGIIDNLQISFPYISEDQYFYYKVCYSATSLLMSDSILINQ